VQNWDDFCGRSRGCYANILPGIENFLKSALVVIGKSAIYVFHVRKEEKIPGYLKSATRRFVLLTDALII